VLVDRACNVLCYLTYHHRDAVAPFVAAEGVALVTRVLQASLWPVGAAAEAALHRSQAHRPPRRSLWPFVAAIGPPCALALQATVPPRSAPTRTPLGPNMSPALPAPSLFLPHDGATRRPILPSDPLCTSFFLPAARTRAL
jgi:hypothetical protein